MLSQIWTSVVFALASAFSAASLCLWLRERGIRPIRAFASFLSRHTTPERVLLGAFFVVMWVTASVKPGGGVRRAPARPADEWDGFAPITSTNTTRTLGADDFRRGFVLTGAGTDGTHGFAAPPNAVVCADWLRFGAAEDWVYERVEWKMENGEWGAGGGARLRIHSDGWAEVVGGPVFCPFKSALGIVPEANWHLLGGDANSTSAILHSQFWHAVTPSGSLALTWQNALFGRDTNTPVSVQMEIWPSGRFDFRYDLRSLECRMENGEWDVAGLTNIVIGASFGEVPFQTTLADVATNVPFSVFNFPFSVSFHPLLPEDAADPDRDGDGLATIDELFVHRTDPSRADTDDDGLSDPGELAAGTDPRNPDTDGDGLLDGEEAVMGTDPLSGDSDSDGVGDFAEACGRGTDPLMADSDGDGVADAAETAGATDPLAADTDGDGLGDAAELQRGTDPRSPDSDGDGAPDGWEVSAGSNPLLADTDGDGLSDGVEMMIGSSPLLADTDGDGVSDFAEFTATRTSPALADTDGDGISDAAELAGTTNPLKADTDGDGLDDGAELSAGTDPLDPDTDGDGLEDGAEAAAGASPLSGDTDGDGMPDAWEVKYALNPGYRQDANGDADFDGLTNLQEYLIGSSPLLADTDGDGRSDYSEHLYGTSPILADTDGDGLDDGDEHSRGTSGADVDTDDDGLPDGWEVAHSLSPNARSGIHGASGDPDGDGVPNAAELVLGTNPRVADTDGDGMDDGDEVGGFRWRYVEDAERASETNGWTAVDIDFDDLWGCFWMYPAEILYVGDEEVYDIACQWNGVLLVSTEGHYADDALSSPPAALSGQYVSDAALTVAPCWVEASTNAPSVCAFRRADGGCVRYAVRYEGLAAGTTVVSVQVVLSFTNGVYSSAEVSYGPGATTALDGVDASVGLQDAVNGRRWSAGFGDDVYIYELETLQFVQGNGTNPLGAVEDADGDGLPDKLEEEIGTDPRQPDTDGDGMHDGWERAHGFDPLVDNGADGIPGNDADADPDGDGLTNGEEADWGTDPNGGDTDGDGVADGDEAADFSDPCDETDGGRPASRVPVAFVFGDPSPSHSEKYRLVVKPKKDPDGQSPAAVAAPRAFEWVNAQYGECETKTAMLRRGWTYEVRMFHAGTRPGFDGGPDYDYSLSCVVPPGAGVVTNDPQRLFGGNGKPMASKVKEVTAKVEELLGLTRDQFVQIVMIAQGQFRELLTADEKVRSPILKKLFRTERYAGLQDRINAESNAQNTVCAELQRDLGHIVAAVSFGEEEEPFDVVAAEARSEEFLTLLENHVTEDKNALKTAQSEKTELDKNLAALQKQKGADEALLKQAGDLAGVLASLETAEKTFADSKTAFDAENTEARGKEREALAAQITRETDQLGEYEKLDEKQNAFTAFLKDLEEKEVKYARESKLQSAEEERQKVAESNDAVIKEFKMEDKKMEERFAVNSPEYRDAFLRKLQGKEITAEERAAVTATAAIPTQTMNEIVHRLELNPMIAAVDMTQLPGYVTYPAESSINNAAWVDMDTAATDAGDALQAIQLGAYKLIKTVEISADVDAMSIDAFEAWLVSRLANKIEKALDAGILTGTGVTQATGIATTKSTADGTFKRAGIKWGDICGIMGKLSGEYHPNASFVMNPALFFGKVLGMTDTAGQRVVVNEPQADRKFNLLGYPVIVDGNCGAEDILFGDLKAYKLNLAKAVEVKRSEEAEFRKGSAVYRAMTLADGKLADVNAIVRYVATT